ncbi:MAG TPA: lysozyme inhibitor LprI family protein [Sphingomicrobium sp.]|nr:lysozyme inhibitor LprI family protein [Sphingomicrobium sp.]
MLLYLIGVISICSHASAGVATPRSDPWADGGEARAKIVIEQCRDRARETPHMNSYACVDAAFDRCIEEHGGGHMSQRDLNDCATFSRRAWEARLVEVRALLTKEDLTSSGRKHLLPLISQLRESERRWDAWNVTDCAVQSELSRGGTIHRMQEDQCLADHAAYRVRELEGLVESWLN